MKQISLTIFLMFSLFAHTQNMFKYEKEVSAQENYIFEEIDFQNTDEKIALSGTLLKPRTDFEKIIFIVPGSGKDTRYSHFILAEEFLKNGIAVYRFDERGIGKSEGKYSESAQDLSKDLFFAVAQVSNKYKSKKIGVVGHSLGGIAACQLLKKNSTLDFIILIETPIIKNGSFLLNQFKMDYENSISQQMRKGKTKDELLNFFDGYIKIISNSAQHLLKKNVKNYIDQQGFDKRFSMLLNDTFFVEMAQTNLEETIKNSTTKILYLTGTQDKIINYKEELRILESFQNPNIEVHIFEELNHWLTDKKGVTGSSLYQMDHDPLSIIINRVRLH
ncbi:alpha-beta hydrolase superfamily lysophospholipase [Flavobacterium sp. CG_9.1]|uniref:alpha/beta fold hydrolase n=1 Tax=Flavobacterium sp. CG_9.1 TaxID=2787728 RepID=UPI0018CB0D05|nr:alpha/beta fold hydrolase [Flavobacterium sp. CG_9.1]MBG6063455.1 alpha-beta hydrolase superfamily lysophospholipase [Flavobacterium sp. CG_9.1]